MSSSTTPEDVWIVNNQGHVATVYDAENKESAIAYAHDLEHQVVDNDSPLDSVEPAHPADEGKYVFRLRAIKKSDIDNQDAWVEGYVTVTRCRVTNEPYSPDHRPTETE